MKYRLLSAIGPQLKQNGFFKHYNVVFFFCNKSISLLLFYIWFIEIFDPMQYGYKTKILEIWAYIFLKNVLTR